MCTSLSAKCDPGLGQLLSAATDAEANPRTQVVAEEVMEVEERLLFLLLLLFLPLSTTCSLLVRNPLLPTIFSTARVPTFLPEDHSSSILESEFANL